MKDEAKLTTQLNKAQQYLDDVSAISQKNPEIIITQAMLNTAYIAFDGQKYGMTLSGENLKLYTQALQLAPNNPRVILSKAEWDIGAASFFGQSTVPFCKDVKRAIELFKAEKQTIPFYPYYGVERAEEVLKDCEK
jgi:chaperone required for assembly of F1-ATPase